MKKQDKAITVITPVYNMSKYLDMCIKSILAQTYKDFVLLLIDDGSTDDSGKICDYYAEQDSRVNVIHTYNCGQDAARNTALENVTTDYIAMIDSDDCVNIHFLEFLMEAMEKSGADIVCPSFLDFSNDNEIMYDESKNFDKSMISVYSKDEAIEELCLRYRPSFVTPQKLYKTSVFEGVKYPPVGVNIDEWVIHHLLLNCDRFAMLDCKLYYYRKSAEGMTRNFSLKKISGIRALIDRIDLLENYHYDRFVPAVSFRLHSLAISFYSRCKDNQLNGEKALCPYKKSLRKAFRMGVRNRVDIYSRKEMLVHWSFGVSFRLYDILKEWFKLK